jgi:hypothetical protein
MRTEAVKRHALSGEFERRDEGAGDRGSFPRRPGQRATTYWVRCTEREHRAVDEGRHVRTLGPRCTTERFAKNVGKLCTFHLNCGDVPMPNLTEP